MTFTVYENRVHNYASIHISSCSYVKMHGVVSRVTPPTGRYYEEIGTLLEALKVAFITGRRDLAVCSRCLPDGACLRSWQRMNP